MGGSLLTSLFTFLLICIAALPTEGKVLDINWLQAAKELVKFNTWWKFYLFVYNIQGEIVFQKLQNLWVAKALMNSYILCKILSFLTRVAQKVFNRSGSYSLVELIILWTFNIQNWFICSSITNRITYANEANIVNKDSPITKYAMIILSEINSLLSL